MPLFDYECTACRGRWEELFVGDEEAPSTMACARCKGVAARQLPVVRAIGPLWSREEALTQAIGGDRMARGYKWRDPETGKVYDVPGRSITSKDIAKLDQRMWDDFGATRTEHGSAAHRRSLEAMRDEHDQQARVLAQDGTDGLLEHQLKTEVQRETDFSDAEYARVRSATLAVERALDAGALTAPDLGAPALQGGAHGAANGGAGEPVGG